MISPDKTRARSWWASAAAMALGSIDVVAAFAGPSAAGLMTCSSASARLAASDATPGHAVAHAGPVRANRCGKTVRTRWLGAKMSAEGGGDTEKWGRISERDQAMGFLSAEAVAVSPEIESAASRQARAQLLAQQAREALEAAKEAEDRAKEVRIKLGVAPVKRSEPTRSNGLSGLLSPVAMQMVTEQGEYLRRCPIRQMQEDLLEIRCGVMNIIGHLGPQNLLALGAVLYAISVIQISM